MSGAVGGAGVLLFDDFNKSGTIDSSKWKPNVGPGSFLGGTTQMRPELPVARDGHLLLELDTFNSGGGGPAHGGNPSFYGSEAISQQSFSRGGGGIALEAKVRLPVGEDGLIGGFFSYGYNPGTGLRDEIDWEFIPKRGPINPQTNIFAHVPPDGNGDPKYPALPGVDLTAFHTYRIEWLPNAVRWLVDGKVVRTESGGNLPTMDMALHLNLWGAGPTWDTGNPKLVPVSTQAQNRAFFMEVDYVRVEKTAVKVGDDGANRLRGSAEADWMVGGGGSDVLRGGAGDDTIFGGDEGGAALRGDAGDALEAPLFDDGKEFAERLFGGAGDDVLVGGSGEEFLSGGSGDDTIRGGDGDDLIIGGRGIDVSTGGDGEDQFVYQSVRHALPGKRLDRITDYKPGQGDGLDLSGIDADIRAPGDQAFEFIRNREFSGDREGPGELRYVELGRGIRVEADVNGDGDADMAFLILGVSHLFPADIIL